MSRNILRFGENNGTGENCGHFRRFLAIFDEISTFMATVRVPPPEITRQKIINISARVKNKHYFKLSLN
tara:strand:+ start:116 stop:322 length:207 start_codon:yes stop_codon:yes gene_type:complete